MSSPQHFQRASTVRWAALLVSLNDSTELGIADEYAVPITTALIRSISTRDGLSTGTLAVPAVLYRSTVYAVPAWTCEPACSDPSERLRTDDLILIESSTKLLRQNLQMLDGKLCAIAPRTSTANTSRCDDCRSGMTQSRSDESSTPARTKKSTSTGIRSTATSLSA